MALLPFLKLHLEKMGKSMLRCILALHSIVQIEIQGSLSKKLSTVYIKVLVPSGNILQKNLAIVTYLYLLLNPATLLA